MNDLPRTNQQIWDHHGSYQWTYFDEKIKRIISFFLSNRLIGKNLELGGGWYLSYPDSTVVDLSTVCLEYNPAQRKVQFNLDDLATGKKLPFEDHSFHSATMISSWQYLKDPLSVMREIERVVIPGGELYIINGQGAGVSELIRQATYSKEIEKFVAKLGYDTLIEEIWDNRKSFREGEFKSVCVALPKDTLFGKESAIKNKRKRMQQQIERKEEQDLFLDAFVTDQICKAWFKFCQLRTYPITKHSRKKLAAYQKYSDTYGTVRDQPLLYLDSLIELDLLLPKDNLYATMLTSPQERSWTADLAKEHGIVVLTYTSQIKNYLQDLLSGENKHQPKLEMDRDALIEFVTAVPLNRYTEEMQSRAYEALKKDFATEIEKSKARRLYSLFQEYRQRSKLDQLIARKKDIAEKGIPIIGETKLDFERFLPHFKGFIL